MEIKMDFVCVLEPLGSISSFSILNFSRFFLCSAASRVSSRSSALELVFCIELLSRERCSYALLLAELLGSCVRSTHSAPEYALEHLNFYTRIANRSATSERRNGAGRQEFEWIKIQKLNKYEYDELIFYISY